MTNVDNEIERLIESYGNDVLKISYLYLKDKNKAEDVFQEVFLKVYENFHKLKNKESEKSWIMSITVNACKDMLKSSWFKRIIFFEEKEELSIESNEELEKNVIDKMDSSELLGKVMDLPTKYKEPILLYYYEEFSTVEIGKILKIPEGTVRSRLHRGRQLLKNIMDGKIQYDG
ncbi:sigma-70 family RNA polymerase sigma factor [Clostridium lundense]|uniref:sigma-70 family RNA polymerase sigma factor n=1 Tax=Clostridium lundense TaxID=319475 RepID=UPI000553CE26|nr:sigma-70 family RNA polymerase sigma factor [Clostridium lundense]